MVWQLYTFYILDEIEKFVESQTNNSHSRTDDLNSYIFTKKLNL